MLTHRPCGACRALVPAATGCGHWHVGRPTWRGHRETAAEASARRRAEQTIRVLAARAARRENS